MKEHDSKLANVLFRVVCLLAAFVSGVGNWGCSQSVSSDYRLEVFKDRSGSRDISRIMEVPDIFDSSKRAVNLSGAMNEVLGFRIDIQAGGLVELSVGDFSSPDERLITGNTKIYRIHRVKVPGWPGWHIRTIEPERREQSAADVLVPIDAPRGGLPQKTADGEKLELWFDVRIPKGTLPGLYVAPVEVFVDGELADRVDLSLEVWPFVLPEVGDPEVLVDVDHQKLFFNHVTLDGKPHGPARILEGSPVRSQIQGVLSSTMRLLQEHGLNPQLPYLYPVTKIGGDGNLEVNWDDYDKVVSGYIDGSSYSNRIASAFWKMPFDESFPRPPRYGAVSSPLHSRLLNGYFGNAARHFAEKGWLQRSYLRIPCEYADMENSRELLEHFAYIAKQADSRLRIMSGLPPQDLSLWGWYDFHYANHNDYVDIWTPSAQFYDWTAISENFGSIPAWGLDRPPFSGSVDIASPAICTQVIPWQAKAAKASIVHLGVANDWKKPAAGALSPQECIDHRADILLYPGGYFGLSEPVASMRLKRLRRGIQGISYLRLLQARGKGYISATIRQSLVKRFGTDVYDSSFMDGKLHCWVEDPALWENAKWIITDELLSAVDNRGLSREGNLPTTIRWKRFIEAACSVDIEVVGVRARPAEVRISDGVKIECNVRITNNQRIPLSGRVSFGNYPAVWNTDRGSLRINGIEPGRSAAVTLTATTPSLTWDENGHCEFTVRLEDDSGAVEECRGRLSHIVVQGSSSPVVIDGDLSDWASGVGNHASNFQMICGPGSGQAGALPGNRTHCFSRIYDDKVYLGFRCDTDTNDFDVRGTTDVSPDGIPMTGECVEILLDPANSGTRSAGDLYRIVISPSTVFWERGVSMNPPVGAKRPWPVAIRHACRKYDGFWTAELEIPLSSFPREYRSGRIWGINFTRFDRVRNEYSNWSGAVGYVYDPLRLGNLSIP